MDITTKDEVKGVIRLNNFIAPEPKKLSSVCESLKIDSKKQLLIMAGCPGTGKTMIATWLYHALIAGMLNRDDFRYYYSIKPCLGDNSTAKTFDQTFLSHAERLFSIYNAVILDATFRASKKRQQAYEIASKIRCEITVIQCECRFDTAVKRLQKQIKEGIKTFDNPIELVLKYYWNSYQKAEEDYSIANIITVNTDDKERGVMATSVQPSSQKFVSILIKILKQKFGCPD